MAFFRRIEDTAAAGVPQDWYDALVAVLSPLGDLRQPVVDHVVSGADPSVLRRVQGNHLLHHVVGHHGAHDGAPVALVRLLAGFVDVDVQVMHRWVRVLESAATGPGRWGTGMPQVRGLEWPEAVLCQAKDSVPQGPLPFALADLARVLELDGATPRDLLLAALEVPDHAAYCDHGGRPALVRLSGFGDLLVEHHDLVTRAASGGAAIRREQAIGLLDALDDEGLATFADVVARGVVANAQDCRRRASPLLDRLDPAVCRDALRAIATGGKPDERGRALQLLRQRAADDADDGDRAWVDETAAADRAASVRGLVETWRAAATTPVPTDDLPPPPLAPVDWAVPRPAAQQAAAAILAEVAESITLSHQQAAHWAQHHPLAGGNLGHPPLRPLPPPDVAADLVEQLTSPTPITAATPGLDQRDVWAAGHAVVRQAPALGAAGTVQLLRACRLLDDVSYTGGRWVEAVEALHRATGVPDLATLQQLLDGVGVDGFATVWKAYAHTWQPLGRHWPADAVWPFVARNLEAVLRDAEPRAHDYTYDPAGFFEAVATLPTPPARALDRLYGMALGTHRSLRGHAQDALARDASRTTRAAAALGDGRGEVRTVAAQWLTRIADPAALPALQTAWRQERSDVVRGFLLDALEAVGEPVADYLDLDATTTQARKLADRGLPAALAWLDWDTVPETRWAASGEPVPRVVVQWLVANAVKARSAEPNALLRRYAELIDPGDRQRLGHHLLAAWLAEDTRPIPLAEAELLAASEAASHLQWGDPRFVGKTHAEVTSILLPGFARQPAGSATASKGLLAVVAATAGRDVVAPVERYLKDWYGQRASQGKALIAMLAWVDHPAATQLVLSVGSRFRTKSFQQEATHQAEALAERKGWTLDELADRTIPTAGFEHAPDGPVLALSYGPRDFTARLLPDLTVTLHDPDGKTLKALPAPRQSDDADLAKDAKKTFSAAKKDVKAIAKQQAERLYEALCTERDWPADDWQRYLLDHPVVGPATRRLVWVDTDTGTSFRPLDDGTLSDVDDEPVTLPAHHRVRLAHDSLLADDQVRRWVGHLADYEVDPLFQQLGKGSYTLPQERRDEREVADHEGHLLEAFALRGRALKSGYTRGPAEDGGWFYSYRKRFPTLGLVAHVGFTGNYLPEDNRTVALTRLTFHRELPDGRGEVDVPLGDVPAVLLSEMVGDLALFAADGTGFDPDWQKKAEF